MILTLGEALAGIGACYLVALAAGIYRYKDMKKDIGDSKES